MKATTDSKDLDNIVIIQVLPKQAVDELQASFVAKDIRAASIEGRSLDGQAISELILILGSSGLIAAASQILVTWLKAHSNRQVKIGSSDIRGYSAEDVCKILEQSLKKKK